MKQTIINLLIFLIFSAHASALETLSQGASSFSAKSSTEAMLSFQGRVEMIADLKPTIREAQDHIDNQLMHLFGTMAAADSLAVPKGEHEITHIKIQNKNANTYLITYDYSGKIALQNGPRSRYEITLPINPTTIYAASMVGQYNPCTDDHYQDEGDFWYFWNPLQEGCRLEEGKDYININAYIERIKNTKITYPEYDRLTNKNGEIYITLTLGMDESDLDRNPLTSTDVNASTFRSVRSNLIRSGYANRILSAMEIYTLLDAKQIFSMPYIERFEKKIGSTKMKIDVFFGPTGIDEDAQAFHYFYRHSLANASLMMYDGHSGLGGYLDLSAIEKMNGFRLLPAKDQYQIYFFNSCSSYTYYNSMYFGPKRSAQDVNGTKNLDILTNGLATYFEVMHETNLAIVKAIELWATKGTWTSYQELAKQIDSENLFGINGDEDNPRKPRK